MVTNVVLQDKCPADLVEHNGIPGDPIALQWVRNALLRDGPADPAFQPDCTGLTTGTTPGASGGGGGTGAGGQPLTVRPTLSVVSGTVRVHHGWAHGIVRCDGPQGARCVKRVVLRTRGRTLAVRTLDVAAGRRAAAHLRLRRTGRRMVRAQRRFGATLGGVPVTVRRTPVGRT